MQRIFIILTEYPKETSISSNILKSFDIKPIFIILYNKVVNESIISIWNSILSETGYIPMSWGGSIDVLYYDLCDDKIEPLVSKELEYYIKNLKG